MLPFLINHFYLYCSEKNQVKLISFYEQTT